jgi:hypothetical protein
LTGIHRIAGKPGFADPDQLFIEPEECIGRDASLARVPSTRVTAQDRCRLNGTTPSKTRLLPVEPAMTSP